MEADWKQVQPQTLTMEQDYQNLQNTILNNNNNNNNINNNNNNNIINNNNNKNQPKKVKKQPSKKEAIQPKNEQKQAASTKPDCINNGIVVVKQELVEDQTSSDSGISPKYSINDGSVSPQSDSSTALVIDCSISPERPVSNGSNDAVQMNVDAYCPNNVSPPMNYTGITPANLETISAMEAIGVDIPSKMEFSKDPLSCPLCVYVTVRKISFSEHLKTHCVKVHEICKPYEFNRAVFKQLTKGSQLQKFYDAASMRLYRTDLGNRVPKIIANKVTVYNCRHCGFRTLTKIEYWQHSREHVKPKKTSTTENKKHNDFHVGDHKGIKPFKCRLCQYACANKSHLDVRQFRCMDCGFSTNYCNQLKTHLRCRGHNQAMVLNPDGTPNPLSFTDVHGTKRGSKAKPKKAANKAQPSTSASPTLDTVQQEQLQQLQQQLLQQLQYQQQLHLQQQQQQYYQQLQQQLLQQQQQQQQQQTSPQGSSDMPQFQLNPEWFNVIMNSLNGFQGFNEQATPALDEVFFNAPLFNDLALACIIAAAINHQDQIQAAAANTEPVALSPVVKKKKIDFTESSGPLDLSKAEDDVQDLSMMNEMQIPVKLTVSTSTDASATPAKPPSKVNRRKGRAFKINPDQVSYYSDEDMPQEVQRASTIKKPMNHPSKASPASSSGNSKDINTSSSSGYRFVCQFCDMSFKDEIMHSIHMGYHDC